MGFFDKDAVVTGHDNFILLGSAEACVRFLGHARPNSPVIKIRYNWILACSGLRPGNVRLNNASMASVYLVAAKQPLDRDLPEVSQPSPASASASGTNQPSCQSTSHPSGRA